MNVSQPFMAWLGACLLHIRAPGECMTFHLLTDTMHAYTVTRAGMVQHVHHAGYKQELEQHMLAKQVGVASS